MMLKKGPRSISIKFVFVFKGAYVFFPLGLFFHCSRWQHCSSYDRHKQQTHTRHATRHMSEPNIKLQKQQYAYDMHHSTQNTQLLETIFSRLFVQLCSIVVVVGVVWFGDMMTHLQVFAIMRENGRMAEFKKGHHY